VEEGIPFNAVAASDLSRSLGTGRILAAALGLGPPVAMPELREFDVGQWSGLTRPQIEANWPGALDQWRRGALESTPGGESRDGFTGRITSALHGLAAAYPDGCLLVVTHGGVIGALQRFVGIDGARERLTNLCGRWFEAGDDRLTAGDIVMLLDPEADSPSVTPVP
jgi:broad specificity phosphatase PhoE